jgi:hypothetical protein
MITAEVVREHLNQRRDELPWERAVADWRVVVGSDWTNELAVWVWIILRDEYMAVVWPIETRDEMRSIVRSIVQDSTQVPIHVYIRFRTESEEAALRAISLV